MTMTPFGPGSLYVTRTDIANPTPVNIGYAKEFSLDFDPDTKQLYGQNQFPLAVARGTIKSTAKAKSAVFSGMALNTVFFGATMIAGSLMLAASEAATVPASTPWTVTVANAASFDKDCGVVNASTGLPLQLVASAPATGQYSVAAGVYTFASADTGKALLISYLYKQASVGQTLPIVNRLIGSTPTFQLDYATINNGIPLCIRLYNVLCDKLSMSFKISDFGEPDTDFQIAANPAGNIGNIYFGEVS